MVFAKILPKKEKGKGKQRAMQEDLAGHSDEIWALSLSSDGKHLATGGKDRRVGIWDVEKGLWLKGFRGHKDSISVCHAVVASSFDSDLGGTGSGVPEGELSVILCVTR